MESLNFEYNNHVHLLEGFYNLETHDYYKITHIRLSSNSSFGIMSEIPIEQDQFKLLIRKHIEKDLSFNKYDKRMEYPVDFRLENFDQYLIEIKHVLLNEHKQLYKLKQFYYDAIKNEQKLEKYNHKFLEGETPVTKNVEILNFAGGAQMPLIKDIHADICDGVKAKPRGMMNIYSEPLTNTLFGMLYQVCKSYLNLTINPEEFVYMPGDVGAQFYYMRQAGSLSPSEFKNRYDNLFVLIDQYANLNGITSSPFYDAYLAHFKKETFENNTWKSRIMSHHLMMHKYAHNGIGGSEFHIVLKIIDMMDMSSFSHMWAGLQFVHSIAHIYDNIYMKSDLSYDFYNNIDTLNEIKRDMFEPNVQQYDCLRKMINMHRSDFLVKTSNNFNQPYEIKQEALVDKIRQYSGEQLLPEFEQQLLNTPYVKTGETTKMVHEDRV